MAHHLSLKKTFLYFQIISLIFILFTSCKKNETPENTGRKIKVGLLLPLTGGGSSVGESSQAALNLALQDINDYLAAIGADQHLEVTIKDTHTDTVVSLQELTALKEDEIQTVIGPYTSGDVQAVMDYAGQMDMMIVSPASIVTSLAIPNDNIFRLVPSSLTQGEAMTALLKDDTVSVLIPIMRDDVWGNDILSSTAKGFTQAGGTVMDGVRYDPSVQDFGSYISALQDKVSLALEQHPANTIGVYMLSYNEGTTILRLASADSVLQKVKWYGSTAYAEDKSLPLDLQAAAFAGSHSFACPIFGLDPSAKDKWQPLSDRIEAQIGRQPDIYAMTSYDALWLITLTYLTVGHDADITTLKKAFVYEAANYFGVTGNTTLNDAGDRAYATYDFWGIRLLLNQFQWQVVARYDNATGELVRY
jgi:branched-chain amino acid transport system substrate-binding protein